MMPPVCLKCKLQMRRKKTGVDVELMAGDQPYQIWNADHFECPDCGVSIITQFAAKPIAEHFQLKRYMAIAPGVLTRFWASVNERRAA